MWEDEDEFVAEMLSSGAMADYFIDEQGEWMCKWNMEILREQYPDVAKRVEHEKMKELEETLGDLVDKGYLIMSFNENSDGSIEPLYALSPEGEQLVENEGWNFDT